MLHVTEKLKDIRELIETLPKVDYLLVVSFGYLIPSWLLELPKIGAINVHPSTLPKYRGSSPGQFALLYGETSSSMTIMLMNTKFDQGDIISQLPFAVSPQENQESYYQKAFALAQENLAQTLREYASTHQSQPQPTDKEDNSPIARRLNREDGFIPYSTVRTALGGKESSNSMETLGPALQDLISAQPELTPAQLLDRAMRAFSPWPGVWTTVADYKGKTNVRLKILAGKLVNPEKYRLETIQYEGEPAQKA